MASRFCRRQNTDGLKVLPKANTDDFKVLPKANTDDFKVFAVGKIPMTSRFLP